MSSEATWDTHPASLCIDGKTDTICHSNGEESHPWIALVFAKTVDISKVVITNRGDSQGQRMKNMRISVSDRLPDTSSNYIHGSNEFATFAGPGITGETEEFMGSATGDVLVIQMQTDFINLAEIKVYGEFLEGQSHQSNVLTKKMKTQTQTNNKFFKRSIAWQRSALTSPSQLATYICSDK